MTNLSERALHRRVPDRTGSLEVRNGEAKVCECGHEGGAGGAARQGGSGYAGTAAGRCGGGVVARWDGTAVTRGEEGTARDSGGDAERKRLYSVVAGREGLSNEEAAVGGGDAEAGACARLWERGRRTRAADVEEGACARGGSARRWFGEWARAGTGKRSDVALGRARAEWPVLGSWKPWLSKAGADAVAAEQCGIGKMRSEDAQKGGAAGEGSRDRHAREGAAAVPGWAKRALIGKRRIFGDTAAAGTAYTESCGKIVGIIIRGIDWHAARIVPKLSSCMGSRLVTPGLYIE
ncbi:hypothetical protein B0H14DRAFT_2577812 [Mycena olivaceomarginata]|nr:hypothetical protein B0H14DRAFT_2577812 [Mycena olivaceomarginata]